MEEERTLLKVANDTVPKKLAGAILKYSKENVKITLRAIGEKAVNQAIKGIATLNKIEEEHKYTFIPYIVIVEFNGIQKEAIEFDIEEEEKNECK